MYVVADESKSQGPLRQAQGRLLHCASRGDASGEMTRLLGWVSPGLKPGLIGRLDRGLKPAATPKSSKMGERKEGPGLKPGLIGRLDRGLKPAANPKSKYGDSGASLQNDDG